MKQNLKLTIEIVPSSAWQNNLRSVLTKKMWGDIRKKVYTKYGSKCAICGKVPKKLHAHEVWGYDDKTHVQILRDIIPGLQRVAIVANHEHPGSQIERTYSEEAARKFGLKMEFFGTARETS